MLKRELHSKPKFSMFCAQTLNYQLFFFFNKKKAICILKQIVWEFKHGITISVDPVVLSCWSKCTKYCFDQYLKMLALPKP